MYIHMYVCIPYLPFLIIHLRADILIRTYVALYSVFLTCGCGSKVISIIVHCTILGYICTYVWPMLDFLSLLDST